MEREGAEALENAIADDIDDEAAYQVWSDWLIELGDPLGEVVATWMSIETERDEARRADLRARGRSEQARLLTEAVAKVAASTDVVVDATFRNGLVRRVALGTSSDEARSAPFAEVLDAILGSPCGRFLRELSVPVRALAACLPVLEDHTPRALVDLSVKGSDYEALDPIVVAGLGMLPRLSYVSLGNSIVDFTGASLLRCRELIFDARRALLETLARASFPSVVKLGILGSGDTNPFGHGTRGALLREETAKELCNVLGTWPALRELRLGCGLRPLAIECAKHLDRLASIGLPAHELGAFEERLRASDTPPRADLAIVPSPLA
jgi:uncharacterized protein (TIGR02996 family)